MTYNQFKTIWLGKGIDFDGSYGYQCMDLAHKYAVEVNGKDFPPAPAAKDVWNLNIPGYDKISNTPTGVPQQGDIVVWGKDVGPYGHIAIFDNGDINSFESFDQNWPVGSLCHIQKHNYKGVLGWLRLKSTVIPQPIAQQPQITDQTRIPQIENKQVDQIRSEYYDMKRDLEGYKKNTEKIEKDSQKLIEDFEILKKEWLERLEKAERSSFSTVEPSFHIAGHNVYFIKAT